MIVKEILKKHCEENKWDGLFNSYIQCSCKLDDFMPCEDYIGNCEPGLIKRCKCKDYNFEFCDISSEWCIGEE